MSRAPGAVVLVVAFALTAEAAAKPCERGAVSFVAASLSGGSETLRAEIEKDLAAELARDNIEVCEGAEGRAPIAKVDIAIRDRAAEIRIEDALTSKAVSRNVALPAAPEDVVALTVALAADELLRASWAELAVKKGAAPPAPAPAPVPPPKPEGPSPAPAPAEETRRNELGARAVFAWYSVGQSWLGADVFYRREIAPFFDVEVSVLGRRGMPVSAPHGEAAALAVGGGAAVGLWPLRFAPLRLGVGAAADAAYVSVEGQASPGAGQSDVDGAVVSLRGGLLATVDASPVRFHAEVAAGAPIVGIEALDDDEVIAGASDLMIRADLGLGVLF